MRLFFLTLFAVGVQLAVAQSPLADSIRARLTSYPQEDSLRVDLLNKLSFRTLKNQPGQALEYAKEALALAQRLKFHRGIGEGNLNISAYYFIKSSSDVALEKAIVAVKIAEQYHINHLLAQGYAVMGSIYQNQLAYEKAFRYMQLAEKLNAKEKDVLIESRILNTRGLIAHDKRKFDSARFYFNEALRVMKEANEDYRVPEAINNIARTFSMEGNSKLALEYYQRSLEAAKKSYNRRSQALALANIGSTALSQKNYKDAEKLLLQSLTLSKEIGDMQIMSQGYMAMGQLKNETGKFDDAHNYVSRFYELRDSLSDIEKAKKIAELEIKYETEKKEHAIQLLERDNKIQLLWANILVTVLVLVGILSIALYFLQESRDRKNRLILNLEIEQLTTQNKELSEKYKDVLTSGNVSIESVDQRLLKKAISVVENNMSDPLFGVEQMAKEMGMSRTNMHRKIKAITGLPPSELIRNIRLRKAANLLLNKVDSVSQISFIVGFEDHSYFSKSFKKQFGVTPSEYYQTKEKLN